MRLHVAMGWVVVVVGLAVAEAPARASSCSFDAPSGIVTVQVDGNPAVLSISLGRIRLGTTQCGTATVTNTDLVAVSGVGTFTLRGDFVPGRTAEPTGASEIEVVVNDANFVVDTSTGNDHVIVTSAGADVNADGDNDVTWPGVGGTPKFRGGAGDDILDASAYPSAIYLYGGDGDDEIMGGAWKDKLWGDAGADVIAGNGGNDLIYGGAGDDTLLGGDGDDTFNEDAVANGADFVDGGAGTTDLVSYAARTVGVVVTLGDGIGNDGEPGENDDPVGVEFVTGGSGNDVLVGDGQRNRLHGGGGNDDLAGGDGIDTLFGDDGDDVVDGDAGNDTLFGGSGNDQLVGDPVGGDKFRADTGDDLIVGNDDTRRESVDCGLGADTAEASALDSFTSCETLTP
jgi:Ca2+-binding RTX toxin-like protein